MHKKIVLLSGVLLLFSFTYKNYEKQDGYIFAGSLRGIDSGNIKLSVYNELDRTAKVIDSGTIKNGVFKLKGKIGTPQMVYVAITPGNWAFSTFLEDTVLKITADTTGAEYYDYTAHGGNKGALIKKLSESGSKNYDDWMQYQNAPEQKQYDTVFAGLSKKIREESAKKNVDAEYAYRNQLDSVAKLSRKWQKSRIDDYVNKYPASVAGVYMYDQLYTFSQNITEAELQNMLDKFQGQAKQSVYYHYLSNELAKKKVVQVGSIAPDFTLLKRDSTSFTLSSTRGKYILIDFWASWCHPCRQAIPHWKEVYQKYRNKDFDIVSVSDDSHWSNWKQAMDKEKMPWTQVCDEFPDKNMPARIATIYSTIYIPFYVLLDKEGKILEYTGDETKIDERLKTLFDN